MTYLEDDDVEEVVHFADHFLLESGVKRGRKPEVHASPHRIGGTSVDYVPERNQLVFRGADNSNVDQIHEDTIKLLAKIYSGIKDDYSWDSGAFHKLEASLEPLPDKWELPFRDSSINEDVNEFVIGSELWKRRSENIRPVIEDTQEKVELLQSIYEDKVRPVEKLNQEMTPEHDPEQPGINPDVYEYFNSDLENIFIRGLKGGDREVFEHYTADENIDKIYDRVSEKETADTLLNEIDGNLSDLRETQRELREYEQLITSTLEEEINGMMDQEEPEPEDKAVAYLVPLLVHGRINDQELHEDNISYIESIPDEEGQVREYATRIYSKFVEIDSVEKPQERFSKAIEQSEIPY